MNYLNLLPLGSAIFCAAIAVFIFVRRRGNYGAMAFSLGMISLALMELEFQRRGLSAALGVDSHFLDRRGARPLRTLETFEQQWLPQHGMASEYEIHYRDEQQDYKRSPFTLADQLTAVK